MLHNLIFIYAALILMFKYSLVAETEAWEDTVHRITALHAEDMSVDHEALLQEEDMEVKEGDQKIRIKAVFWFATFP